MARQPVFEPDDEYDRICASDGVSRYDAYLDRYAAWFAEGGLPTADAERFAAAAWRIALPPIMSPGYVRVHGLVRDTQVHLDDERCPTVSVDLAMSSEPDAAESPCTSQRWCGELDCWHGADDSLTVARIAVPLASIPLPDPRYQCGQPDTATAKAAVRVICAVVNAVAGCAVTFDPPARSPR